MGSLVIGGGHTFDYDDLIILVDWMVLEGYDADSVAEAVHKPWQWADELEQAKADLTGRA